MLRLLEGAITRKREKDKEAVQPDVEYNMSGRVAVKERPPKAMDNWASMCVDMLE